MATEKKNTISGSADPTDKERQNEFELAAREERDRRKKLLLEQEELKKEFAAEHKKADKSPIPNDFLCEHCRNATGQRLSIHDEKHMRRDEKTGRTTRIVCDPEKEFWLIKKYYDDTLSNIPLHKVAHSTDLMSLYTKIPDTYQTDRFEIESAFIISDAPTFYRNLKCFVKQIVWDKKFADFSYVTVNIPKLRDMKLGDHKDKAEYFSDFDTKKLVVLDLTVTSNKVNHIDSAMIEGFVANRQNKFLPLWILSHTVRVTNKHIDSIQLRSRLEKLKPVKIGTVSEEFVEEYEYADTEASEPGGKQVESSAPAQAAKKRLGSDGKWMK